MAEDGDTIKVDNWEKKWHGSTNIEWERKQMKSLSIKPDMGHSQGEPMYSDRMVEQWKDLCTQKQEDALADLRARLQLRPRRD